MVYRPVHPPAQSLTFQPYLTTRKNLVMAKYCWKQWLLNMGGHEKLLTGSTRAGTGVLFCLGGGSFSPGIRDQQKLNQVCSSRRDNDNLQYEDQLTSGAIYESGATFN